MTDDVRAYLTYWKVDIGYRPTGNEFPQSSMNIACERKPTFQEIKALWEERNLKCILFEDNNGEMRWYVVRIAKKKMLRIPD